MFTYNFFYTNHTSKSQPLPWSAGKDMLHAIYPCPKSGNFLPTTITGCVHDAFWNKNLRLPNWIFRDLGQFYSVRIEYEYEGLFYSVFLEVDQLT